MINMNQEVRKSMYFCCIYDSFSVGLFIEGLKGLEYVLLFLCLFASICSKNCSAADTISIATPLQDSETMLSSGKTFKLGFFSPGNSTNRYVGIMFNVPKSPVVWVANRDKPLNDSSGVLTISEDGDLVVLNGKKEILWSSNVKNPVANSSAQLMDDGNLVLSDDSTGSSVWESFQNPTDSFLQKMKIGEVANSSIQLTSWRSPSDPSIGNFTLGFNPLRIPEVYVWNRGVVYWRSGPWNGNILIGIQEMSAIYQNRIDLVTEEAGTIYFTYYIKTTFLLYTELSSSGNLQQKEVKENGDWYVSYSCISSECDEYGKCGPNGRCDPRDSPICSCLQGFEPRDTAEWSKGNWSGGCSRKAPLQCQRNISAGQQGEGDGYLRLTNVKVPDLSNFRATSQENCSIDCSNDCSCSAYTFVFGIGCLHWNDNLIDIQKFPSSGADLFIRVAYSELDHSNSKWEKNGVISSIVIGISLSIIGFIYFICKKITKSRAGFSKLKTVLAENEELHLFSYDTLADATDNFHSRNMIGKGGFGPVYMGKLTNGQEIAVKTLSNSSTQGNEEFMNEVMVISKLQHRNLVRLLGCCAEREEKLIVYEYMPNKSLDTYIFDSIGQDFLDWKLRQVIIEGISRGLLYLHRDSRLKIIHRDLKTSNILLDAEFNPKISDFGLARIFGGSEDQANTNRVVGTYGYMAPEYAMQGKFSEKSDVYSFGVLLLEILSGTRNVSFCSAQNDLSLIGHAWELWQNMETAKFIDPRIFDENREREISKYIHIGLLCVQEYATDRPTMSAVLLMLHSHITELPRPKLPAYARTLLCSSENKPCQQIVQSSNDVTITILLGR